MFSGSAFAAAPFAATGSSTFNSSVDEAAAVLDEFLARAAFSPNILESSTAADSVTVIASTFSAAVAETATGSDSATVSASTFGASIAETSVAADTVTVAPSTFNAAIAETATAIDAVYAYLTFICAITEGSTITDVTTARLLWELINDSQTAGWATINTAQSTTWTTINDSAPTTWSDIPTLD